MTTANPDHVAAEEARVAWLNGWELDFRRRRYAKISTDGRFRMLATRHKGQWAAVVEPLACTCLGGCAVISEHCTDSADARARADNLVATMATERSTKELN